MIAMLLACCVGIAPSQFDDLSIPGNDERIDSEIETMVWGGVPMLSGSPFRQPFGQVHPEQFKQTGPLVVPQNDPAVPHLGVPIWLRMVISIVVAIFVFLALENLFWRQEFYDGEDEDENNSNGSPREGKRREPVHTG